MEEEKTLTLKSLEKDMRLALEEVRVKLKELEMQISIIEKSLRRQNYEWKSNANDYANADGWE